MARDRGLEELVAAELDGIAAISEKAMFGGWAWLLHGNLLAGARQGSLLLRIGKDKEAWALSLPGVVPAIMGGRRMNGWVRAGAEAYGDDASRRKLVAAACHFVSTLAQKVNKPSPATNLPEITP